MDKKELKSDELAKLIQITSCMLDALKKTSPLLSNRARYLESAQFLLKMAFESQSIDGEED